MRVANASGMTMDVDWISGPTLLGANVVIKTHPAMACDVAEFFDGSVALMYTDADGRDVTVAGYSIMAAMTRRNADDGWLVTLAKA